MALPKIDVPTYELTLPSEDKVVQYRPFLVKEEKLLMIAMESGEDKQVQQAVLDLVNSCTFGKLKPASMPIFDIEYLFLNIRAKSIGEIAKFQVFCPEDKVTLIPVEIDLTKVEVQVDDNHTNNVVLDEKRQLGLSLNYPNISEENINIHVISTSEIKVSVLIERKYLELDVFLSSLNALKHDPR